MAHLKESPRGGSSRFFSASPEQLEQLIDSSRMLVTLRSTIVRMRGHLSHVVIGTDVPRPLQSGFAPELGTFRNANAHLAN
ncbi:MAG: hypothetical protein KF682_15785 [Nitrospira sp.]|nr:hypothetical protein [Nitrospira sp.]